MNSITIDEVRGQEDERMFELRRLAERMVGALESKGKIRRSLRQGRARSCLQHGYGYEREHKHPNASHREVETVGPVVVVALLVKVHKNCNHL